MKDDSTTDFNPHAPYDLRSVLVATDVTLNGQPARIVGRLNAYATVRTVDPSGPSCEFAWDTAAHIVATGGAFKS